jgi:transcriptional regulator with XRE-family HTH domain
MKTSVPYEKIFARFSPARQKKIKKRAAELIAEEFTLRDLRKAKQITQQEVAKRLSGRQVYVSRLERRADMKLSTLRQYVRALGGDLQLMVTFPGDGEPPRHWDFTGTLWRCRRTKNEATKNGVSRRRDWEQPGIWLMLNRGYAT